VKYERSAPTVLNIEITDLCNEKCRHCYNFWRENNSSTNQMTKELMDKLLNDVIDSGVFHVVFSGGEPLENFKVLEYGLKKLCDNNISVSVNSNLAIATEEKIKRLIDAGVDHILTSLNSFDPKINDYIVNKRGTFERIIRGIELSVKSGIRISVNMIVSQVNKEHVYETGKLAYELGCQKIFGTRVIPSVNVEDVSQSDYKLEKEDVINILEQLVRIKEDTGIMIGTLVSYPLCLLKDLERYVDFVGRGCPGQSGHFMNINASGETHACVHEKVGHGNVFKIGLRKAYQNMNSWRDGSYMYEGCTGCDYIDICKTGCRMSSHAYSGKYNKKDNLMVNKDNFVKPYKIVYDESIYERIDNGLKFFVPKRLRFRKEFGFYLINIRWANTISSSNDVAEFLIRHRDSGEEFDLSSFGKEKREILAKLYFKDVVESRYIKYSDTKSKLGLSADFSEVK